ncbi:D-alanine--D-alanine ligase [Croceitalea sp. P059]|uniref:D-alanine--D-alanine ligase n=1 Tax=Croceitalea sp. P059 TaxID=3075601 RepID=UPI00288517C3|nr:D-alanine--D-alanine ligase [Croceitalea sp. P059]MDT0541024.1 D-alanine--D-alanine ligase [Croceitalea sp. P059]
MKKNIAIIMGGYSNEFPISIKSGSVVTKHLSNDRFITYPIVVTKESWYYNDENQVAHEIDKNDFSLKLQNERIHFDCVFNAIHGSPGEDGLLQAYFSLMQIPQTSCAYYQAALTFNKRDFLSTIKPYGINCATSYFLNYGDTVNEHEIIDKVGLPCFVKANKAGSSFGISKVYKSEQLKAAINKAFDEDDEIIIESFLDGTEISVGVITYQGKVKVLPITEIVSDNDFFDYEAKYQGKSQEITPARITDIQWQNAEKTAKKVYEVLKMEGYTRSEFIFIGDEPFMLEMNTTPGLTEESILPQQAQAAGISLSELFESAIDEALKNFNA